MNEKEKLKKDIAPINNHIRKNKKSLSGTEILLMMWDVGDLLAKYIKKHQVKAHSLYWDIYGNSEGILNTQAKSNITREFLQRSERIRRFFNKNEIKNNFAGLSSYNLFREAMPFFTGKDDLLTKAERNDLIALLNSDQSYEDIKRQIISLKSEKEVGRPNPRDQRLGDVEPQKNTFYKFYKYIELLKEKDNQEIINELEKFEVNIKFINFLAFNTNALMQDDFDYVQFNLPSSLSENLWKDYALMLQFFINEKTPKNIKRFRRVVELIEILDLSTWLDNITNEFNESGKEAN